ncbi:hypothetical protein GW17_00053844 [Ensete ventricosum]|nr:hypothetical protein GW17_00053844 [Ensete ventricosum]RZS21097.1 hypothetical protein BHM03_00053687 [Ensete ventricosum]
MQKPGVRTEERESAVGRLDVGTRPVAWLPSADSSACSFGGRRWPWGRQPSSSSSSSSPPSSLTLEVSIVFKI